MIYEYAVDPILMTKKDIVSILDSSIGPAQGRLISDFPNNWYRQAAVLIKNNVKGQTAKKARIKDLMRLKDTGSIFNRLIVTEYKNIDWLTDARNENKKNPFHAIYADLEESIPGENILGKYVTRSSALWRIPESQEILRRAKDLGAFIKPLLELSGEIVFEDQYFDPTKWRFCNVLEEFLNIIDTRKKNIPLTRVGYHISNNLEDKFFKESANTLLPKIIPKGITLEFRRSPYKSFHRRSVITNICTVGIESGLDEYQEGLVHDDDWDEDRDSKEIDAEKTQIYNIGRERDKLENLASKEIFHQVQGEK